MARPADSERRNTREHVRDASFRLFGRFGYDGVSMLTVARHSGVTKAALYWHYDSKEALYADCMKQLVGVFEEHVFESAARQRDPIERIFALFAGLERLVDDSRLVDGVAGYWLKPSTAKVTAARTVQAAFEQRAAAAVEYALEDARRHGALAVEGATGDIAQAFIALIEAIVLPLGNRSAREHRRVVGVLAHIFFQAHANAPELVERAARLLDAQPHRRRDSVTAE